MSRLPKSIADGAWGGCALGAVVNYARHGALITASSEQPAKPAEALASERGVWASASTAAADTVLLVDLGPLAARHVTRVHALGLHDLAVTPGARVRWRALSKPSPDLVVPTEGDWTLRPGTEVVIPFATPPTGDVVHADDGGVLELKIRSTGFEGLADIAVERIDNGVVVPLAEKLALTTGGNVHQFLVKSPNVGVAIRLTSSASTPGDVIVESAAGRWEQGDSIWRSGWESAAGEGLQKLEEQTLDALAVFGGDPVDVAAFLAPDECTDAITTARYWEIAILDGLHPDGEISARELLLGPSFTEITVKTKPKLREIPHTRTVKPLHGAPRDVAYARSREMSFEIRAPIEPAARIFGSMWSRNEPCIVRLLPGASPFSAITLVGRFGKDRSLSFLGGGEKTGVVEGKVTIS